MTDTRTTLPVAAAPSARRGRLPRPYSVLLLASLCAHAAAGAIAHLPGWLGMDPGPGWAPAADIAWMLSALLLAGALLHALTRREPRALVLLDAATIAAAAGLVAGVMLIGPALAESDASFATGATQLASVVCDIVVGSLAVRVLVAPRGRPLALWLLAGAAAVLAVSGAASDWLTMSAAGAPGAWAGFAWIAGALLIGLAVLHPSAAALADQEDASVHDLRSGGAVLLGGCSLVAPALFGLNGLIPSLPDVDDAKASAIAVLLGGLVLTALVVARFLRLLGSARALNVVAARAFDERGRLLDVSEARFRRLVEQLPAVIVLFSLGDADHPPTLVYASPQTEAIMGFTPDEWMTDFDAIGERMHPDDRRMVAAALERAASDGIGEPVAFRITRPDGREIWLEDSGGVVYAESDGSRYLQGLLFDVTDARSSAVEHDRMELELSIAQRLEAVGQLAAGIAHEINTPIQFVGDTVRFVHDAFTDLIELSVTHEQLLEAAEAGEPAPDLILRSRAALDAADLPYLRERLPAAFQRADDGISRVATIVRAMREFAHPPTQLQTPVDLNAAVTNTLVVAANEYKYVATVETDLGELPLITANGGDINQVLLNLIVNAGHAIEDADRDGTQGVIRIRTRHEGDHVRVSISDTGCGIPAGVAGRIFEPFFTTKEVGRGTGQGLAISRTVVVERHGGSLTFETRRDRGTTFHVRLPVAGIQPPVAAEAAAA